MTDGRRRELAGQLSAAERRLAELLRAIAGARRRAEEAAEEQDRAETEAQNVKVEIYDLQQALRGG